jgi:phosphoribosyl 1,2-cyclic phosphodiesterase
MSVPKLHPISCTPSAFGLAIETNEWMLIDAGFTQPHWKNFTQYHSLETSRIRHVLLTHEHQDHVQGLGWWLLEHASPKTKVWCTAETRGALSLPQGLQKHIRPIPSSGRIEIGDIKIETLSVVHDAVQPVAYKLYQGQHTGLIVVDAGMVTATLRRALSDCDWAFVSPYYDETKITTDEVVSEEIQRITSKHGHLSNQEVSKWLKTSGQKLARLSIGHRHHRLNTRQMILSTLTEAVRQDVIIESF